ncbi:hypothetical protein LK10_13730 [Sinomonas humi]|uniref:Inosine/uridine-preferring nucleoside hydrolase domain-containing protein n=1 Tax=Sinomonas humi TaxID=1338436 RepID=A0A0B2AJZ5_9MICC|nr:hypothetical protein LK10_13730 [Sinomonas humi]
MTRLAIDCDPGNGVPGANIDDGLALALAVASPHVDLELVTTVAGNVPAAVGGGIAHRLFQQWDAQVPIVVGANRPLVADPGPWRRVLDRVGMSEEHRALWAGIPRPKPAGEPSEGAPEDAGLAAADALGRLVTCNPGQIVVVGIGPLTNIALAVETYPRFARDVAGIVVMGGAFAVAGRPIDTNFGYDPQAAQTVIASGAPLTVVPLDTTVTTMFTAADLERLRRIGSAMSSSLMQTVEPWLRYSAQTRGIRGFWLHDLLTVAMLIEPSIVTTSPARLTVSLDSEPHGVVRRETGGTGNPVTLVESVDNAGLLEVFFEALTPPRA